MNSLRITIFLISLAILEINSLEGNTCGKKIPAPKGTNQWGAVDCKNNCLNYNIKLKFILKATSCVKSLIADFSSGNPTPEAIDKAAKASPKIVQCLLEKLSCMDSSKKGKVDKKKLAELCTILSDKTAQNKCKKAVDKCVDKNYAKMTSDANSYKPFMKCAIQELNSICPNIIPPALYKKYAN